MFNVSPEFYWIAVVLIIITAAARITRLVVADKFPPMKWLRTQYEDAVDGSGWEWLTMCGYCFSFWSTLGVVLWADLAGVFDGSPAFGWTGDLSIPWWFIINGTLGASYLAAILMANDGDGEPA